jgi:hypothetical protein
MDLYRDTPIKPIVSPLLEERDLLGEIEESAARHGLKLTAWTVTLHNSALGRRYPEHTVENAFGDRYPHMLCPADPAVREFVRALCQDLSSNHDLMALELEHLHFGDFAHYHGHQKVGVELGPVEGYLLSLCFCPSCLSEGLRQGVSIEALRQTVREELERVLAGRATPSADEEAVPEFMGRCPELRNYAKMRSRVVASLTEEVRAAARCRLHLLALGDHLLTGASPANLAPLADALEVLCYTPQIEVTRERIEGLLEASGAGPEKVVAGFAAHHPDSPTAETLVNNVRRARELGVWGYSFYNYGMLSWEQLDWIRRAVEALKAEDEP